MQRTDEKKPTGGGNPTAGSTDRAIVAAAPGADKRLPIRTTSTHLLLALNDTLNSALLRAWCASPSSRIRATFRPGAKHTTSEAAALPDSEVFSRPEFMVLGVGNRYPQGRGHRFGGVLKPHVHPVDLSNRRMAFVTPEGAKTMTPSHLASRRAAPTPTTGNHDPIQLFADATNALAMATYYLRQPEGNHAGAARKAGQALAALRRLAALQEGGAA